MTKNINTIGITILVIVILALCAWRMAASHLTHWFPMDYIGILGFGVTLMTAWYAFMIRQDVKQLSDKYSLKLALPPAQKRLVKIRTELKKIISDDRIDFIKANAALLTIVANCLSECDHLGKLTENQFETFSTTKEITFLCREINLGKQFSKAVLQKLYTDLSQLINDVDITVQNLNDEVKL